MWQPHGRIKIHLNVEVAICHIPWPIAKSRCAKEGKDKSYISVLHLKDRKIMLYVCPHKLLRRGHGFTVLPLLSNLVPIGRR